MKHLVDKYVFILHIFPLMKWKFAKQMYFQKGKANNSAVQVFSLSGYIYLEKLKLSSIIIRAISPNQSGIKQ